ncbi:SPOR domain-containing protein [Pelistega sp. MC2]|uniref:SPOR domain-containing protein n=1 Tax=Pelistega sp. MC2 TaxID=1720297 RepID=UPI0008D906BD|nr:SPOR domain-containing protein [Pelistega sp. MC2]
MATTKRKPATRRSTKTNSQSATTPFGYIIFGIVMGLGLAAALAYYLREKNHTTTPPQEPAQKLTSPAATSVEKTPPKVIVTEQKPSVSTLQNQPAQPTQPINNTTSQTSSNIPLRTEEIPQSIAQSTGTKPTTEPTTPVVPKEPTQPQKTAEPKNSVTPNTKPEHPKKDDAIGNLIQSMNNSQSSSTAKAAPKIQAITSQATTEINKKPSATFLQIGSFKDANEADAKRAELLMHGISNVTISQTTINNTEFTRVRIGPFTSESELKKMQNLLKSKNINSTLIR